MKKDTRTVIRVAVIGFISLVSLLGETKSAAAKSGHYPEIDAVVTQDGSGDFTSIQAAINSAPDNSAKRYVIYIKNGNYNKEKLIVPASKTNITLLGEDREKTVISYFIYDCNHPVSENKCPADAWALWKDNRELIRTSATLTVMGNGFIAENMTIANTAGPVGQALALTLRGDKITFRNCDIKSYQDTIYLMNAGMCNYFHKCLVIGRTDYIYGSGIGYFDRCEIRSWRGGWITAPSTPGKQSYGFVFNHCKLTYRGNSPRPGDDGKTIAIGRPWHNYPKVAILHSEMCKQINPKGWPTLWHMDYAPTSKKLHLYEYKNKGQGADMSRRSKWAGLRAMTAREAENYTLEKVFNGWMPVK